MFVDTSGMGRGGGRPRRKPPKLNSRANKQNSVVKLGSDYNRLNPQNSQSLDMDNT